ncbi:Haloacid dehalogenase-like hydrolase-domain-containing protein, partial [Hysterangium stoloniferum]
PLAFAFDIDGVLLQGSAVLPQGRRALQILEGQNAPGIKIPYILITNGGGYSEEERCMRLSSQLGVEIRTSQLVQAHTILRQMAEERPEDPVLVLGGSKDRVRKVAEGYGFKNVYIPSDILAWNPDIWPFYTLSDEERSIVKHADFSDIPFSSILVFHDPRNWSLDIQIVIDILRSHNRCPGSPYGPLNQGSKPVELVFCNPDILWRGAFDQPRIGQGAFVRAFQSVYKSITGMYYPYIQHGKPHEATYRFAEIMLRDHIAALQNVRCVHFKYGMLYIHSELRCYKGANAAEWSSILVRTGVYDPSLGPPTHTPTHEASNVEEAVRWALNREGIEV